ncbi:MAG: ectonucleotide pyrophosphatase/phosphodiesterase [Tenacibaculum sp.]
MNNFKPSLLLAIICFAFLNCTKGQKADKPYVVLVSFDGFRHDYAKKHPTPNFTQMSLLGVAAKALIPSFPSKTFPNHYTIVTGLYPSKHGLVDNAFYDKELDLEFSIKNRKSIENPIFYKGKPLWQLVQENGMKSASCFWVGSETAIGGSYPDYYFKYKASMPNSKRIKTVINWLKLPADERPQFISLYFSLVDNSGHKSGPNSVDVKKSILEADRLLGVLRGELAKLNLNINLIVVSDHGMAEIKPKKVNYLSEDKLLKGIDKSTFRVINSGTHAHIYLKDTTQVDRLYQKISIKKSKFKLYKKANFPKSWQYSQSKRVGDLLLSLPPGYYLSNKVQKKTRGVHGYDPAKSEDMNGIFYAQGSKIRQVGSIPPFKNIHIYPFIAKILNITHLPEIDGKLEVLYPYLKIQKQ